MISLRFHLISPFSGEMNYTGIPLRAAFLNLLKEFDEELSSQVHGSKNLRAYSLDPLPLDSCFRTEFDEGEEYTFGIHIFNSERFADLIKHVAVRGTDKIRLHHHYFPVKRIDFKRRHTGKMMEDIASAFDTEDAKSLQITMNFTTPTQLSQYGSDRAYLLPAPDKIFSSLLRVWNSADDAASLENISKYRDWITENVYISGHRLRTVKVSLGRGRFVIGFVGKIHFRFEESYEPFVKLTLALAKFAEFSNLGKNRTAGLGKVSVGIE
ncbi:MAG: CRISPR system precrRNA processing endoribonuclease RAMP protein Cas6 [Promethearchaeia archaeon]